ncbi:MAG TPA: ATP-grasp domain-containing protein [Pyrinomonadaceae bacterium]|nr:ATP-grasp domain-containing protein [Pyrinomonadaceae bacterium]
MPEGELRPINIICLATYYKGADFMRECKARGCHVVLITKEKMLQEDWPRESLDDLIALPNDADVPLFIDAVTFLARKAKPDRVIALEEFDVVTAALIREHFCLPGMSSSQAKIFRDKMAMAVTATSAQLDVPAFLPLITADEIREFMVRVPPPWIIKPRSDVSAIGIRKVGGEDEVWRTVEELNSRDTLREKASYYLLAQFIDGAVYHVDSLVNDGRVAFAAVNQYGRPPLEVAHQGGTYISYTIAQGSDDHRKLLEVNRKLIRALRLEKGATHAEFIKSAADGKFYFLEIAARVGGAYIADVLEAASGINLWREWARIEIAGKSAGRIRALRKQYAGIILSLARQEHPDTSAYDDPEIVYRIKKRHHAGLILSAPTLERVTTLLAEYARRFVDDFAAVLPPLERPE